MYEQLPPSATSPACTHCTPSLHCATVPLSHCPQPPLHLSLIMFDCCHCSRTFHGAGAPGRRAAPKIEISPSRSKGGCVGVEPEPEPAQSPNRVESKPKLGPARIWHCLSCPCCLSMSPSVSPSLRLSLSLFWVCSFFLLFFCLSFPFGCLVLCRRCSNYMLLKNV